MRNPLMMVINKDDSDATAIIKLMNNTLVRLIEEENAFADSDKGRAYYAAKAAAERLKDDEDKRIRAVAEAITRSVRLPKHRRLWK